MTKFNKKQQFADEVIKQVTSGYIFDLENDDNELLADHENIVSKIYNFVVCNDISVWIDFCNDTQAIKALVRNGYVLRYANEYIRFCGKEFMMQRIEYYVARLGY